MKPKPKPLVAPKVCPQRPDPSLLSSAPLTLVFRLLSLINPHLSLINPHLSFRSKSLAYLPLFSPLSSRAWAAGHCGCKPKVVLTWAGVAEGSERALCERRHCNPYEHAPFPVSVRCPSTASQCDNFVNMSQCDNFGTCSRHKHTKLFAAFHGAPLPQTLPCTALHCLKHCLPRRFTASNTAAHGVSLP